MITTEEIQVTAEMLKILPGIIKKINNGGGHITGSVLADSFRVIASKKDMAELKKALQKVKP